MPLVDLIGVCMWVARELHPRVLLPIEDTCIGLLTMIILFFMRRQHYRTVSWIFYLVPQYLWIDLFERMFPRDRIRAMRQVELERIHPRYRIRAGGHDRL